MIKRILLSLFFLVGGYFLVNGNAQNVDGFFKASNNEDIYNNRGDNNNGITLGGITNNENPTAPLGSGLLIMVAAGAGYAVARRKNAARKGMTMLVALSLILGMTGCKKDIVTPVSTDNGINITLNANYGDNGSKTTFDPEHGTFAWAESATEYINVGGSVSGYLGQLTNAAAQGTSTFAGTLDKTPKDGETLYFFYLGNGDHEGASTVDFSSQDGTLANVTNCHIAIGSEKYTGQTSFTATLNMAMAIAYFDLSGFNNDSKTAETVYLSGNYIYTTASVNYNDGTITGNSKGMIKVGTANDGMYVALIPSVTTSTTLNFNSSSKAGSMTFNNGIKPAYFYSNSGGALLVVAAAGSGIPGTFSVSATKKVFFSKGNLQYQASTGTWRFAENQYDYVGDATNGNVYVGEVKSNNNNIADDYTGWIDLFGCGTGNTPTKHTTTGSDYSPYVDWGTSASGYIGSNWRAMSSGSNSEWEYIYKTRSTSTSNLPTGTGSNTAARYMMAKIANTYKGIILFPDIYKHPNVAIGGTIVYNDKSDFTATISSTDDWRTMEAAGAVFLPAAGYRSNTTTNNTLMNGYYWGGDAANSFIFSKIGANCGYTGKFQGCSVRLVKDVE